MTLHAHSHMQMNLEGAVSAVKHHYEKYLYPYERFLVRDNKISTPTTTPTSTPQKKSSVAGTPSQHGASSRNVSPATMSGGETSPTSSSPLTPKKLRSNKPAGKEVRRRMSVAYVPVYTCCNICTDIHTP